MEIVTWRCGLVLALVGILIACNPRHRRYLQNGPSIEGYRYVALGFYNVENLFDTLDDPHTYDEEFTPEGAKHYHAEVYEQKIARLARVIADMARGSKRPLAVLGIAEVENRYVLRDLVKALSEKQLQYRFIHRNSPDQRGIDVGMLYAPGWFQPLDVRMHRVDLSRNGEEVRPTRDIMEVKGVFGGDTIFLMINHWPSRRGGREATEWKRIRAAQVARRIVDSIYRLKPTARIVLMGDFNDEPVDPSIVKILQAKGDTVQKPPEVLFNPALPLYQKGVGSLAYRDAWSLFDQIILSRAWLEDDAGWQFVEFKVFRPPYLKTPYGQYKGYPLRTYAGNTYLGGYSDHFPVYIVVRRPK